MRFSDRFGNAGLSRALICGAFLCSWNMASACAAEYAITDLGVGSVQHSASGINNNGQVAGGDGNAVIYENGLSMDLGVPGSGSFGVGINDAGDITGQYTGEGGYGYAFVVSNGKVTTLGTLGGSESEGRSINNSGQIAGFSSLPDDATRAVLYSNGSTANLGTLGGSFSIGTGINQSGVITGYSATIADTTIHGFIYSNGTMVDIGDLGGGFSEASAINNSNQITGSATTANGVTHAFIYADGVMTDLGAPDGTSTSGNAINDLGQVVGQIDLPDGSLHPFLYSNGIMSDLTTLIDPASGWTLESAGGINDEGDIVGEGFFNGQPEAFLLTPDAFSGAATTAVPEPATLSLLALALPLLHRRRCR
jgi:probable HAF family extracellular repeat protein